MKEILIGNPKNLIIRREMIKYVRQETAFYYLPYAFLYPKYTPSFQEKLSYTKWILRDPLIKRAIYFTTLERQEEEEQLFYLVEKSVKIKTFMLK